MSINNDNDKPLLPYEKCEVFGFESLTDEELLAIIIRSGTCKNSSLNVARKLLDLSNGYGIGFLQRLSINDLMKVEGIGKVKAIKLKSICELSRRMVKQTRPALPVILNSEDVFNYMSEDVRYLPYEQLHILMLDIKCRLISKKTLSIGTINSTIISPRDICREVLQVNATFFILVHNHPSGDPTPSNNDITSTKNIYNASKIIGIEMIDHIIIGDNRYVSMKDTNVI